MVPYLWRLCLLCMHITIITFAIKFHPFHCSIDIWPKKKNWPNLHANCAATVCVQLWMRYAVHVQSWNLMYKSCTSTLVNEVFCTCTAHLIHINSHLCTGLWSLHSGEDFAPSCPAIWIFYIWVPRFPSGGASLGASQMIRWGCVFFFFCATFFSLLINQKQTFFPSQAKEQATPPPI